MSQDAPCSAFQMQEYCKKKLSLQQQKELDKEIFQAKNRTKSTTAWRIEGTLREFPKFEPVNLWFDYPVHRVDNVGTLMDINPNEEIPSWKKAIDKRKPKEQKEKERKNAVMTAFEACGIGEKVTVQDMAEYMGVSEKTVRNRIKEHGGFVVEEGNVRKKT